MAFKPTKKFWIHLGAGTVAVIVLAWGMTQCSSKQTERQEKQKTEQDAAKRLENAAHKIDSLLNTNRGLNQKNADLSLENEIQADSIIVLNDSIAVLNDSLTNVNARLEDCQKGKVTQHNRRAGNNNSRQMRPVSTAKTDSVIISVADSAHNEGAIISNGNTGNVRIEIGKGAVNKGQIIVNGTGIINYRANQFNNTADSLRRDTIAQKSKWINQSATVKVVFVKQR